LTNLLVARSMALEVAMDAHSASQSKFLSGLCRRCLGVAFVAILIAACSAPAGPEIVIDETGWEAVPATVAAGGGEFTLTVTNQTGEGQAFAVIFLYEGEPGSLPTVDGLLDLDQGNWVPGETNFWFVYPEYEFPEGEGVGPAPLDPAFVGANAEMTFTIGGPKGGGEPGTYVVVSWAAGGYEAGDYAAFTITE